jgi:cbb3-type cytochrome oxidase subunit 3
LTSLAWQYLFFKGKKEEFMQAAGLQIPESDPESDPEFNP